MKKNDAVTIGLVDSINPKVLKIMKISFFLLFVCTFSVNAAGYSQTKITLSADDALLRNVIREIESKSDYTFFYNEDFVDLNKKVTYSAENEPVADVLANLGDKTGLDFKVLSNNLVVITTEAAGSKTVTGTVTDEKGVTLPGVSIQIEGTSSGTVTDVNGKYTIDLPSESGVLLFTFIGYAPQKIAVKGGTTVNVILVSEAQNLQETVVVGYGTMKKSDITGSIVKVGPVQLISRPVVSAEEALQGWVPGLNISQRASSPGELGTVTIRSLGSITAGTSPLWVIDGVPTDQRNAQSINPADIQSIEVLKDASATAIYGSRGSNGVIIITTKSGVSGVSTLNVSLTSGVATMPQSKHTDVLNAEEYVQYHKEKNGGTVPDWITNYWDGKTDTDWLSLIAQNGMYKDYSLSASGGADKVTYLLSGGYLDQQGIIKGETFGKYSARLRVDYKPSKKFTIGLNIAPNLSLIGRRSKRTDGTDWASLYAQALLMAPIVPESRADGTYSMNSDMHGDLPVGNPLETMNNYDYNARLFRMITSFYGKLEVFDGLTLMTNFSSSIGTEKNETYYTPTAGQTIPIDLSPVSTYDNNQGQSVGWLNENTINYNKTIKDHSLNFLGGFTLQKDMNESVGASVSELQIPGVRNVNIGKSTALRGRNGYTASSLVSYLARLNYTYKGKYLATGTIRTDGSSRFGINKRFHTFGSGALGWRFSEESFLKGIKALSNGKLRLSYGQTGSNSIPDFASRASMNAVNHSFGTSTTFGAILGLPGNPNLTWETSNQVDLGLDLGFLNNRFIMVVDYFNNKTTSLLLTKNIVPSSGYSSFLTNIGSMRNQGIELSIDAFIVNTNDWKWSVGGNVTYNKQEILDLGGDQEIFNFFGALRRVVGGELQQIQGPKVIGIARVGDDQSAQPLKTPGAYIYEDVNIDGTISNFLGADGQLIGDTNLDWIYGLNTKVSYKNFDLSALFNGQLGGYVYDFWQIQVAAPFRETNLSKEYWYSGRYISETNPGNGKTPAANGFDTDIAPVSGVGVQKTDFFRIRNLTLTYNLQSSFLSKLGANNNGRIFASVDNLYTFTNFIGGNPESRRESAGGPALIGGSQIASVTDGRELGLNSPPGLPLARTWSLGVSINF